MGFLLKWTVGILLAPLYSFGVLLLNFGGPQILYRISFRVVNRTSRPIWITPVGTWDSGEQGILEQFITSFSLFRAFRECNLKVRPGGSRWIHFDRKGLRSFDLVVCDAAKEYRQLALVPTPSKENGYRQGENYVIEDWDSLVTVPSDVLAAALKSGTGWLAWVYFSIGLAVFAVYCWLLDLYLGRA
jgi:hypothetical protein